MAIVISSRIKKGLFYIALLGVFALLYVYAVPAKVDSFESPENSAPVTTRAVKTNGPIVEIGQTQIPVELATSSEAIQKGLSGRPSLDKDKGLLFIFSKPYKYRFWMPDMNFPIDIIWINNGKIVEISKSVTNKFDPAKPVFYAPQEPAQYVLEVNAGFSDQKGFSVGDSVLFKDFK